MVARIRNMLDKVKRHPRTRSELLSVLLIAVVFVVASAYWPLAYPPTTVTAASSGAPVSAAQQSAQVPAEIQHSGDAGEASWPPVAVSPPSFQQAQHNRGADEDQPSGPQAADSKQSSQTDVLSAEWRAQQDAAIEAEAAAQRRQEEQKDAWLERRSAGASNAPNDTVVDQHDALKEKLMIEHGLIGTAAVNGSQRQEELKERWLEQRGVTGAVALDGSRPEEPYPSGFEQPHRPNTPVCSYECMELQIP